MPGLQILTWARYSGHRGWNADVSFGVWEAAPELMFQGSSSLTFLGSSQVHWFSQWYYLTSSNLRYFYSCSFECCISIHACLIEQRVLDIFPTEVTLHSFSTWKEQYPYHHSTLNSLPSTADMEIFMTIQVNPMLAGWTSRSWFSYWDKGM